MNWNETLRNNVTRAQELKTYMRLTSQEEEHMTRILEQFPMTVTRYYLSLIDWNNPEQDPVFRMSIPSIRETDLSGDFDTSGEADNTVLPGLQHKYRQTALILSTHRCAMYCRHCFRKRLVGIPCLLYTSQEFPPYRLRCGLQIHAGCPAFQENASGPHGQRSGSQRLNILLQG